MSNTIIALVLVLAQACASLTPPPKPSATGEVYLSLELLTAFVDGQGSLACMTDAQEAFSYIRTIRPHFEKTQDEFAKKINSTPAGLNDCHLRCECQFAQALTNDGFIRLSEGNVKILKANVEKEDFKTCLSKWRREFCKSKIFKQLERDRKDFEPE
jgi:hypothetical protein